MKEWTDANRLYDPEEQEPKTGICSCCHEEVPVEELTEMENGDKVCECCHSDYLAEKSKDDEISQKFIAQNEKEFFLQYWFDQLDDREKLEIAKKAYKSDDYHFDKKNPWHKELETDFCQDHEYFDDFLRA